MPQFQELLSFHIIELDKQNQIFMTWTYPTISEASKTFTLSKISLDFNKPENFTYFRNKNEWLYITKTEVFESDKLNNLKSFALVLITTDFNPGKYSTLSKILCKAYCKCGTPVELVKLYLSVYTTGACSTQENGTFVLKKFDNINSNDFVNIKELINLFGLEIILLYTAILLKKRVVIYHHSQAILLKWMPTVTALIRNRNPTTFLFPTMELINDDLSELKNNSYFVAGFKDSVICTRTDLYDLLVNLPAVEISIMPHAKDSLTMTKTHKDIAMLMVQLAENSSLSETQVITEITNKTEELIRYLKSLASAKTFDKVSLTVDDIKSKNLHPAVENFLINLASAENFMHVVKYNDWNWTIFEINRTIQLTV